MSVSSFLSNCSKNFRHWDPETYPKVYSSLSLHSSMKIQFSFLKQWEIASLRSSKPGVFQSSNVSLPEDIEQMLSLNHKFIFDKRPTQHDVEDAKYYFARSVRIRYFFRNENKDMEFEPKFHIPNPEWQPPCAPKHIETGISKALEVIDSQVSQGLLEARKRNSSSENWKKVQVYLRDNKLLCKMTDKNLGLAVFPILWYNNQVLELLNDRRTYRTVPDVPTDFIRELLDDSVDKWNLPKNMTTFIRKQLFTKVPEFHGLPKVHKNPWKLRPIVPSFGWITTATSKVIDHLLQPLLKHMPWIVNSSKEVIRLIENVKLDPNKKFWIITGDISSFYTNIPPKECSKIAAGLWKLRMGQSKITPSAIRNMIEFVMSANFFKYNNQYYHQQIGLAMGTPCAPVLANIYGGYFERKERITSYLEVALYARYIDDIFVILQADTFEEAEQWCINNVHIKYCTINWEIEEFSNHFLDIQIMKNNDPITYNFKPLDTKLYRKPLNLHLYIPWSSAHPLHVKRGFITAELTRFAMISSRKKYFVETSLEFYGNLRRRGYPAKILEQWFKEIIYDNRTKTIYSEKIKDLNVPLMLPGHYNPVWDYIKTSEIINAARSEWFKDLELPHSLNQPLIRSLSRTTSLFDLLSIWNKTNLLILPDPGLPEENGPSEKRLKE